MNPFPPNKRWSRPSLPIDSQESIRMQITISVKLSYKRAAGLEVMAVHRQVHAYIHTNIPPCLPKETSLKITSCSCSVSCASAPCQYALEDFLISHFRGLSQKKTWYFSCDLFLAPLYFYQCVFILVFHVRAVPRLQYRLGRSAFNLFA